MTLFEFLKDFKETHPNKKLRLPKKFVRKFGETLLNVAFLKPTLGFTWKIGLTKSGNGKVWLNNGWPEFVRHFGLDKGRSVFFGYLGNSEFSVSIFDNRKSVSQIYCDKNPNIARPEVNSVNAIEISGSYSLSCSDDDEVSLPQRKRVRTRADNRCKGKRPMKSLSNEDSVGLSSESEDIDTLIAFGKLCDEKARGQGPRSPKPNAKDKAHNPSFEVSIRPITITSPYRMHFPVKFLKNHLKSRAGDVVLYGSNGGVWRVKMTIYANGGDYLNPMLSGWSLTKFVNDNKLAVGDSCTFELIDRAKTSFNVTIDRAANHSGSLPSSAKLGVTDCNEPSSVEPFFEAAIGKTPRHYLRVPYSFGSVHLEQKVHRVMLEVGERLWPITFLVCQRRNYLGEGYFVFVQQNSLKEGDICKYQPKEGNKGILKVTIFRCNEPRF